MLGVLQNICPRLRAAEAIVKSAKSAETHSQAFRILVEKMEDLTDVCDVEEEYLDVVWYRLTIEELTPSSEMMKCRLENEQRKYGESLKEARRSNASVFKSCFHVLVDETSRRWRTTLPLPFDLSKKMSSGNSVLSICHGEIQIHTHTHTHIYI